MFRLFKLLIIAGIIALAVRHFVVEGIYVASASMEPTLFKGRYHFLEKVSLLFVPLKRGDIIVFPSPVEQEKDLIKRVIALPGDTIEIRKKAVYLNGHRLFESYVKYTRARELLQGDEIAPLVVPPGKIFVMGDNRDESGDSRDWKNPATQEHIYFVAINRVKGKIVLFY